MVASSPRREVVAVVLELGDSATDIAVLNALTRNGEERHNEAVMATTKTTAIPTL